MPTRNLKQRYQGNYTKWAIVVLLILGLSGIFARMMYKDVGDIPGGDEVWVLTLTANIRVTAKQSRINIAPPWSTPHLRVIGQKLQHTGLKLLRGTREDTSSRDFILTAAKPGDYTVLADFIIHKQAVGKNKILKSGTILDTETRNSYLKSSEFINTDSPEVFKVLEQLSDFIDNKQELVGSIFDYTSRMFVAKSNKADNMDVALRTLHASTLGRARAMVALSRAAGIPARIVTGFVLEDTVDLAPYHWVEIYDGNAWQSYDPEKGYAIDLPDTYLPFRKGQDAIIKTVASVKVDEFYSLEQEYDLYGLKITQEKRWRDIFDLERFPPTTRNALALILLLPLGALVTAIVRTFMGFRSYGTFTPTLLALAVVYADKLTAIVLLGIVIALAMSGRTAMPNQLSRIPRLTIVFTLVAMSMTMAVSLLDFFQNADGAHAILLPVVILTTLVDRFYTAVDDNGAIIALRRLAWTMFLAFICYFIVRREDLGYLVLAYPEIHFFTLAAALLLSIYNGLKISDLPLFAWIKEPAKPHAKKTKTTEDAEL
jgi:hypothetical protein